MTDKITYTDSEIDGMIHDIIRNMVQDNFVPDYIVGITRGGVIPAVKLSHYFGINMETLKVSLRDGDECESNCWMAEDAFGYVRYDERELIKSRWDIRRRKNILIVDDINDTGATMEWIKKDWMESCLPNETEAWNAVWNNNVKFATLVDNEASNFVVDYSSISINKAENPVWIEFPWENWWNHG
jgi:hypoxanthine phosphoribosyltransferase